MSIRERFAEHVKEKRRVARQKDFAKGKEEQTRLETWSLPI